MTDAVAKGDSSKGSNFIRAIIDEDLAAGKHQVIHTRFPPEPNGYLHIGHAKAICLNFGLARDYQGFCHLRFDDTNPAKEDVEFVESIKNDVRWLGFDWQENLFHASDYFDQFYEQAIALIKAGKAYVCHLNEDEIREYRGTVNEPGKPSPYRDRSVAENLDWLEKMRSGSLKEGECTLRGKIDMAAANMKLRDPLLYRIRHVHHDRTGDKWCIYPMYDFAHPLSDALEGITHSICTLEFENNRDIYDWVVENCDLPARPHQYEFARLNLNYTVMSKRKLLELVEGKYVSGWDDPRMPTIAGMRRRGFTAEAIRDFCERIGVAKANSTVDFGMLEFCVRDNLNMLAPRVLAVLDPLKVVIESWPEDKVEMLDAAYYPHDVPKEGSRPVPFTREVFIERSDFMKVPAKKFIRLAPGREVRLRHGYVIKCEQVIEDEAGNIVELRCSHDPATLGTNPADRKIGGTIHWVPASHALKAEVRLYDRLFSHESPGTGDANFIDQLNPNSLGRVEALVEPSLGEAKPGSHFQFERTGYFFTDPVDSKSGALVFNRTVGLRDSWSKLSGKMPAAKVEKPKQKVKSPQKERVLAPEIAARVSKLQKMHKISSAEAETLATNAEAFAFFEATLAAHSNAKLASSWVTNQVLRVMKDAEHLAFGPLELAELLALIDSDAVSSAGARDIFADLVVNGGSPKAIMEARGLRQVSDSGALEATVGEVLAAHPDEVARFKAGEKKLTGFFVGQIMKASRGKANPKLVNQLLGKLLA